MAGRIQLFQPFTTPVAGTQWSFQQKISTPMVAIQKVGMAAISMERVVNTRSAQEYCFTAASTPKRDADD